MGFGSFISHLVKPVLPVAQKIVSNPIVQLVQPELALVSLATGGGVLGFGATKHSSVQPPVAGNIMQPGGQSFYYTAPQYTPPTYPAYSPPMYGGSPWDYSTPSTAFSAPHFQTSQVAYSQPATPPIWEDLASLVPLFL